MIACGKSYSRMDCKGRERRPRLVSAACDPVLPGESDEGLAHGGDATELGFNRDPREVAQQE